MTEATAATHMQDAKGRLVPLDLIKPQELLEDQTVRKIVGYADDISARIARFKAHTFDDIEAYLQLLTERYGGRRGGAKGNVTLTSFDGTLKVVVQVQDSLTFGPELQVAKGLFDACIGKWAEGADDKIRALVDHAFQVDQQGRINRASLFGLRRLQIDDPDWQRGVQALNDSIRVAGSREYFRFYRRAHARAPWQPITVDIAAAPRPDAAAEPVASAPPQAAARAA